MECGWSCRLQPGFFAALKYGSAEPGFIDCLLRVRMQYKQIASVARNAK